VAGVVVDRRLVAGRDGSIQNTAAVVVAIGGGETEKRKKFDILVFTWLENDLKPTTFTLMKLMLPKISFC